MGESIQKQGPRSKLGSKKEVRPGVWEIRVSCGYTSEGKQRRMRKNVHGTEADADAAMVRLADEMGRTPALGDPLTLDAYFWWYFLPLKEASTTVANAKTYRSIYRNHIAPHLGGRRLAAISNLDVQRWVNGLPPQSAPAYARALRAILNQARFDHLIAESPMEGYTFRMPRGRRTKPLPVWGAAEVAECLVRMEGHMLYPLWLCMAGCGLSRSEALALDWEDVSWAKALDMDGTERWRAVLPVEGAYTAEDGMKEPKNDRRLRRVAMRPLFADRLRSCKGSGPICKSTRGTRLSPCYVPRKWAQAFERGGCLHGMPFVQLNRMRATYSTLMQQANVDSTIINAMQGRSENSQVLYTNYLNPDLETFDRAGRAMERLIAGA